MDAIGTAQIDVFLFDRGAQQLHLRIRVLFNQATAPDFEFNCHVLRAWNAEQLKHLVIVGHAIGLEIVIKHTNLRCLRSQLQATLAFEQRLRTLFNDMFE